MKKRTFLMIMAAFIVTALWIPSASIAQEKKQTEQTAPRARDWYVAVKFMTGKISEIPGSPSSTVETIKQYIQFAEGIPTDKQRLLFNGKMLDDGNTLESYGIVISGAIVHCIIMK